MEGYIGLKEFREKSTIVSARLVAFTSTEYKGMPEVNAPL